MSWWSDKYNRPLKDPVLLEYTTEELTYEYYLSAEREKARRERDEEENDKIEEAKAIEADDWADQMEAEEEAMAGKPKQVDPMKDPRNLKWMEEEMERDKQEFGEDFGEDIDIEF